MLLRSPLKTGATAYALQLKLDVLTQIRVTNCVKLHSYTTYSLTVTHLGNWKSVTVTRWLHTVSLYPDIFYYKKGQLGIWRSVTVTRWLYTVSL